MYLSITFAFWFKIKKRKKNGGAFLWQRIQKIITTKTKITKKTITTKTKIKTINAIITTTAINKDPSFKKYVS